MNGAADLGGMMGFGPVEPEACEPPFHAEWERRAFAITLAMGATGSWNIDQSRFARESLPPGQYLMSSYYQIWLAALEKLLAERGLVSEVEMASGGAEPGTASALRVLKAADVEAVLARGGPVDREPASKPAFAVGDNVVARNMHPEGHTRLPRYLRGRPGQVAAIHGCHVFADASAAGRGEEPQWLYSVAFSARDLWGRDGAKDDLVMADCWEPYLERG